MTGYSSKKAMSKAAEMMSDKGYEESTHEKQAEFASKRNSSMVEIDLHKILLQAIQDLTFKVEYLRARVESLESLNRNDGK